MGTWNDEDTNRLFESAEKLLQSLTNEMNGYNYNTTGGTDMGKVRLTVAETDMVEKYKNMASSEVSFKQDAVKLFIKGVGLSMRDEQYTRLIDAILHGYAERRFKLKLWGVKELNQYVYVNLSGNIVISSRDVAGYFTQSELDNNGDLEHLADGCIKEYEA